MELCSDFIKQNLMGPNVLKTAEKLTGGAELKKGMKILDLGCGKGLTSIYLAEKFGTTVFATDLFVSPTENYERFRQVNRDDLIFPIRADADSLPYADGFFDAAVSINSYHYFGAEAGFLEQKLLPAVKSGGLIMIAVPVLKKEFGSGVPEKLLPYWHDDINIYTASWWQDLWQSSGAVEIIKSSSLENPENSAAPCNETDGGNGENITAAEINAYFETAVITAIKK